MGQTVSAAAPAWWVLVFLLVAALPAVGAAQGASVMPAPVVMVPDVNLRGLPASDDALRALRDAYTDAFAYALASGVCGRLQTQEDLRQRLLAEQRLQELGADDGSPESQARIAAAARADHLGLVSIGRVGNALVVNASLVEVRGARVVARASARASTPAQLPAALRAAGRQLSQSAGWRAPADVMLVARHQVRMRARGMTEAATMLDGRVYIATDAIRTELSGSSALMLQMASAALAGDTSSAPSPGGLWMLTQVNTGEVLVVNDANRTVMPLLTDGVVASLGQLAENAGQVAEAFGTLARDLGRFVGAGDSGPMRQVVERLDVAATRIQDSVWVDLDGSCPPALQRGGAAAGRVRCEPGRMQVRISSGDRTATEQVNGFTVEHWQVRHDRRARLDGGPDVARLIGQDPAEAKRERRMDQRTLTDFWVPRGAGFCLPALGTATADPLESSVAKFDQMANTEFAPEFRRVMAALRAVPGGATRTVTRDWDSDVTAAEPVITHQVDITDVRQLPRDAARFVVPSGYRRLTLPAFTPPVGRSAAEGGAEGNAGTRVDVTPGAAGSAGSASGAATREAPLEASASKAAAAKDDAPRAGAGTGGSLGDKAARATKAEAKEVVDETKAEAKAEVRDKVEEAKAKAKEAVKGGFRGLLKKAVKDTGGR